MQHIVKSRAHAEVIWDQLLLCKKHCRGVSFSLSFLLFNKKQYLVWVHILYEGQDLHMHINYIEMSQKSVFCGRSPHSKTSVAITKPWPNRKDNLLTELKKHDWVTKLKTLTELYQSYTRMNEQKFQQSSVRHLKKATPVQAIKRQCHQILAACQVLTACKSDTGNKRISCLLLKKLYFNGSKIYLINDNTGNVWQHEMSGVV